MLVGGCGSGRTTLLQPAARARRAAGGPVHRRGAHGDHAGAFPARGHRRVAVPGRRHVGGRADGRARRVRRDAGVVRRDARTAASEPATFLLDEFLELRTFESFPGLRRVLHELRRRPGGERQPVRADEPLHRARAAAAARSIGAVRSHPHAGARPSRTRSTSSARPRHPTTPAAMRRTTPTISRAPSTRSPTAGRPTSARSPTSSTLMREHGGPGSGDADQRAGGAARRPTAASRSSAASATSCGCTARAATARSRRFSRSSAKRKG